MKDKPKVNLNCVADQYSSAAERIVEYSAGEHGAGGLISLQRTVDDGLRVDLYRHSSNVEITASAPESARGADTSALRTEIAMGDEDKPYAKVRLGRVRVTVYESLGEPGRVIVDVDHEDEPPGIAVTVNDATVHAS